MASLSSSDNGGQCPAWRSRGHAIAGSPFAVRSLSQAEQSLARVEPVRARGGSFDDGLPGEYDTSISLAVIVAYPHINRD